VNEKPGEPVRIADRRPELDRAAQVGVRIAEAALTAEIRILPPLGKPWPTVEELKTTLKEYGVVHGIREDVLQRLVSSRIDGMERSRHGTAPGEGRLRSSYTRWRCTARNPKKSTTTGWT
jgi:uncharacterized protein (DUF342 family)